MTEDPRQSAKVNKTALATDLFRQGFTVAQVVTRTGLSDKYAAKVAQRMRRRLYDSALSTQDYEVRCQRHADALIAHGGFLSLSEVCIGHDARGNRRMVATLPLIHYQPWRQES